MTTRTRTKYDPAADHDRVHLCDAPAKPQVGVTTPTCLCPPGGGPDAAA